ncbi:hypothetical protein CHFL109739_03595 [Chryseobacterium flavum]
MQYSVIKPITVSILNVYFVIWYERLYVNWII